MKEVKNKKKDSKSSEKVDDKKNLNKENKNNSKSKKSSQKKAKISNGEKKIIAEVEAVTIDSELVGPDLDELSMEITEDLEKQETPKSKRVPIVFGAVVFIILVLLIGLVISVPKIYLNGSSKVRISYNNVYKEKGARAKVFGKDISNKIKVSGKVNTSKVGEYEIVYKVKFSIFKVTKVRKVTVVDLKKPKITLDGEKEVYVCPDKEYEEIGFSANDEYDGDLTDKVKVDVQENEVIYEVKDSSNNTYSIKRKLNRSDIEKPTITLNGNQNMYITLGTKYNEPGYSANDNCGGDLTGKVIVSGNVNTSNLGTYEITYKVSDDSGNTETVTRKVTVQKEYVKRSANLGCGEAGVIYLTFDDGPNNSTTTAILNVLKKYNVKATFFVTNTNGGSDSQIKREYDEGHLVALHTSTHNYAGIYKSSEAYFNDLNNISARVERITGKKSLIIRFPGGSSNTVSRHYSQGIMSRLASEVESKGYSYFDWNIDSRDAEGQSADQIYSNVVRQLSKSYGNVILMHDIKYTTANAIERIVQYGLSNGYTFKVLNSSIVCHHKTAN